MSLNKVNPITIETDIIIPRKNHLSKFESPKPTQGGLTIWW